MKIKRVIGISVIAGFGLLAMNGQRQNNVAETRTVAQETKKVSTTTKLTEASNSDASLILSGSRQLIQDKAKYTFRVRDNKNDKGWQLYETVLNKDESLIIPFNSWSSDYKHLFLEAVTKEGKDYYVFNADGSVFKDGKKYLSVMDYWKEFKSSHVIDHVSGWAGEDLLVVYTTNPDGSGSYAYWFVIGSRKFMQVREL